MRLFVHGPLVLGIALAAVAAGAAIQGAPPSQSAQFVVETPAGQPAAPLVPGRATVVGRVVEAGTTGGLADALVMLSSPALGSATTVFTNGVPGGSRRVSADGQGRFLFRDLPPGSYSVTVTSAGYVDGAFGETRPIAIRRATDLSRTVVITAADRLVNVTIQMWKLGGISGAVLDEAGEPLIGVPVAILARTADWGGPVMKWMSTALTDDRGMYHADVTPGDYVVGFFAATTTVPTSAIAEYLEAQYEGGPAMTYYMNEMNASGGIMPRNTGTRVGTLMVTQTGNLNNTVPPLLTQGGRLWFYPTTFYPSSSTAAAATLVAIRSGEEATGINVNVKLVPALRVSGRVTASWGPAVGIGLRLVPADPAGNRASTLALIDLPAAVSDLKGDFVFVGVAPGTYTLRVIRTPLTASEHVAWAAEMIAVGDIDLTDVRVVLQTGAPISGRVIVEGNGQPPPRSMQTIMISPRAVPGTPGALQTFPYVERPDDANRFTTRELIPGPYMIEVANLPEGWVVKSVTSNGQNVVDAPLDVRPPGVSDVIVTITDRMSRLSGRALDAGGRPTASTTVVVFPTNRALWRLPGMPSRRVQVAAPARDGRFEFRGLPAGDYFVAAVDGPAPDFTDAEVLASLIASAPRVTIADGAPTTQDLIVRAVK